MTDRRAKILCTIGPAVDTLDALDGLIEAGMDVARLNFSHGEHAEHARRLAMVRDASKRRGKHVAVLQDLCGPKIRTGTFDPPKPMVGQGDVVELIEGDHATYPQIAIQEHGFAAALQPDDRVLIDDGRITFRVESSTHGKARCVAEIAGELRDRVGVHLPARSVQTASFTEKDKVDLDFGLSQGVDYVALSFVRAASDLKGIRAFCEERGKRVPIVSKIETPQAIEDLEAIVEESDGVMVARGDLGVEFPPEQVPVLQKRIIEVARRRRIPVIVATEMLQSMVTSTRPTRAEASDVAHAVFDGADAVMLSAESATGKHPKLAVQMMSRIVATAEQSTYGGSDRAPTADRGSLAESIAFNAADIAEEVRAKAIVAFTSSGLTARLASQARARVPVIAFSPSEVTCRRTALSWGVVAIQSPHVDHPEEMVQFAASQLLAKGLVARGDLFVAVFGAPVGSGSGTNSITVRSIG